MQRTIPAKSPSTRSRYAFPVTSYPIRSRYPRTNVEWLYIITLWHPRIISNRMLIALTKNAGTGETILDNLGPAIRIQKIPAMDNNPWDVRIPKSACLKTSTASSTVTPTTLLSLPVILLYNRHTKCHDKIHFKIIDQNMPSFLLFVCGISDQLF